MEWNNCIQDILRKDVGYSHEWHRIVWLVGKRQILWAKSPEKSKSWIHISILLKFQWLKRYDQGNLYAYMSCGSWEIWVIHGGEDWRKAAYRYGAVTEDGSQTIPLE